MLRSTDAGATWTQLGAGNFVSASGGGARFSRIIVDPATAGTTSATLYGASSTGLYKSVDGGTTWTLLLTKGYGIVSDVALDPASNTTIYAAAASPFTNAANGIYKSVDAGLTWTQLAGGLPTTDVGRIAFSVSPVGNNAIYAAIEAPSSGNLLDIYRSTDHGTTWLSAGATGAKCNGQCWYNMAITADRTDTNVVYFSGFSLYRSVDRGATFTDVGGAIHVDHHAFAFDPSSPTTIFAGSDGGIFRSPDNGATWTSLNANLAITQFYAGISLHPTAPFPVLGGTQDNGTLEFGGAAAWTPVYGGDGGFTATNYLNPDITWVETQWISASGYSGPNRADSRGGAYARKVNGIGSGDRALFIPPLVMSPSTPTTLYFGTQRLYRTRNNGEQWTFMSPNLSKGNGSISAIAPAARDSNVVYVGASDGNVSVTVDGGTTWTQAIIGLPNRYVSDIIVDPAHSEIAFVSMSGFQSQHVFKTVNRGASWTSINGNLPDVPVNAIVRIPGGDLFAGTDLGVYVSGDGGISWTRPATGLPNIAVFDLAFNRATSTLVAATHGRGMFSLGVTPNAPATQLIVERVPAVIQTGAPLAITVSVRETAGYTVAGATNAVTATIVNGGGALGGTTTVSAVNGIATFTNLSITGATGPQTISFAASGLTSASTTVNAIPPIALAVSPNSRRDEFANGTTTAHADSASVTLTGAVASTTAWGATNSKAWTILTTSAGVGSGLVRWTRSPAGRVAGTYVDTIVVTVEGATGSPARIIDTMTVRPPGAFAYFLPDTIRGMRPDKGSLDLVVDLSSLGNTRLGAYTARVVWDSTVVTLDSLTPVAGFAAPSSNAVSAREVRFASSDAAGAPGDVRVARLWFQFRNDTTGRRSAVTPSFSVLTTTTNADLLPALFVRDATAYVTPAVLRGDVTADGKISAADAQAVLQAVVGLNLPAGFRPLPNGDANCSGTLQAVDAQIILSYVVGSPVGQFCVGKVR